ncbi:MAG: hypothetical protein Q4E02_05260 [Lagierella massiliensis]|nr:hypothetical protein [Lagierella massiliensis]
MGKLLKYELKKSTGYFLYLILGALVTSALLILGFKSLTGDNLTDTQSMNYPGLAFPLTMIVSIILATAVAIAFVFYVVTNYKRDLYRDESLLKFSLPIDGKDFLKSKLINITIWTVILYVIIIFGTFFLSKFIIPNIHKEIAYAINEALSVANLNISHFIFIVVLKFLQTIFSFIMLYFSITFTKAAFKDSKSGILWFLIYLGISAVLSIISYYMNLFIPYRLEFYNKIQLVERSLDMLGNLAPQTLILSFNLASAIFYTIITLAFFYSTIYMLDNKVDL